MQKFHFEEEYHGINTTFKLNFEPQLKFIGEVDIEQYRSSELLITQKVIRLRTKPELYES